MRRLVIASASMNVAMVVSSAMSTIVVADRVGEGAGGLPNTAAVLGTAVGALAIGHWTRRIGRGRALRTGYFAAGAGGILTVAAASGAWLGLLFAGMALLGAGNASALLSRYAAAERSRPERRSTAMSAVVGAGAVGAVVGPLLLEPSRQLAGGLSNSAGPFVLATIATFVALAATARLGGAKPVQETRANWPSGVGRSAIRIGALGMLVAQLVMVLMMTAVPVHAHRHGEGLAGLGVMLSVHVVGMTALAPLTGWWIDRAGPRPALLSGLALVGASAMLMTLGQSLVPALFLLGWAWNLCYLGGSAIILRSAPGLESALEAGVWGISAIATAASTWLFAAGGFGLSAMVSLLLTGAVLVISFLRWENPHVASDVQPRQRPEPCLPDQDLAPRRPDAATQAPH